MADDGELGHKRGGRQTNSKSSSLSIFRSIEELKVFEACGAVHVETGDMFLRNTQNGEFVPALVALRCADKRQFARALLFSFVALSVVMTSRALAQVKKSSTLCHIQFLSLVAERWVPGSVNS